MAEELLRSADKWLPRPRAAPFVGKALALAHGRPPGLGPPSGLCGSEWSVAYFTRRTVDAFTWGIRSEPDNCGFPSERKDHMNSPQGDEKIAEAILRQESS